MMNWFSVRFALILTVLSPGVIQILLLNTFTNSAWLVSLLSHLWLIVLLRSENILVRWIKSYKLCHFISIAPFVQRWGTVFILLHCILAEEFLIMIGISWNCLTWLWWLLSLWWWWLAKSEMRWRGRVWIKPVIILTRN